MDDIFGTVASEVLKEYGPFALALIGMLWYHSRQVHELYGKMLKAKDEEIERLVAERNVWQEAILDQRKTTQPSGRSKR